MRRLIVTTIAECVCVGWAGSAAAQNRLDQADPTIAERALPDARPSLEPADPTTETDAGDPKTVSTGISERVASAIVVDGRQALSAALFSEVIVPFVGRNLTQRDLTNLAGAVADVARRRGYPFATATILPQSLSGGVLRVTIDEGRIDAVRVIGGVSPIADRILTAQLTGGRSTTRRALERAIQLVEDIPGVGVKESRFVRQNGFNILLVTIEFDRAAGYVQVDNRGSKEVGPIRSTFIGSVRGVFQPGDELGLVTSNTPLQANEFAFARARYSSVMDRFGSVMMLTTAYGRAKPGASLDAFDVVGNSLDITVAYARPLLRSRIHSLWASAEFRALRIDQKVLGIKLRDDRLATLTGALNGFTHVAGGVMRGEIAVATGLPLPDVTHAGDSRASRRDGDARFMTAGYTIEWSRQLNRWLSLALSSAGQVASRPLLATAEIGVGGPTFARGYDTSERTGDQGILGAAELRADLRRLAPRAVSRAELYGFVDGGHVSNLGDGTGGGSLLSVGGGLRVGLGRFDGGLELAVPVNSDRFDTGNRRPRLSIRIARSF